MLAKTSDKGDKQNDAFPWRVMSIISLAALSHSISITSLYPFIAFMVVDLGLVDSINEAGAYAGYIAGVYMTGRFCSSVLWGIIADTWGRKPVMVIGVASIGATSVMFGLAKSFAVAILSRFLMGFMNVQIFKPNFVTWGAKVDLLTEKFYSPPG